MPKSCTLWLITETAVAHPEKNKSSGQHLMIAVAEMALSNRAIFPAVFGIGLNGSAPYINDESMTNTQSARAKNEREKTGTDRRKDEGKKRKEAGG